MTVRLAALVLSLLSWPSLARAADLDCLDGDWDFGANAAVIRFACAADPGKALIVFCKRDVVRRGPEHRCTGSREPIDCRWDDARWLCERGGEYPLRASLTRVSASEVLYRFKSKFNEGELAGTFLRAAPSQEPDSAPEPERRP